MVFSGMTDPPPLQTRYEQANESLRFPGDITAGAPLMQRRKQMLQNPDPSRPVGKVSLPLNLVSYRKLLKVLGLKCPPALKGTNSHSHTGLHLIKSKNFYF